MSRENLPPSGTRGGRQAAGGVSISTSLSVIVAAIAVLLGFLILRDINRDRGGVTFEPGTDSQTEETLVEGEETSSVPVEALDRTGFKVLVANASGVQGAAGQMTTALQAQQFIVSQPVNSAESVGKISATVVYYVPGYDSAATIVADVLGGVQILPVPVPPPVESESLGEAVVLVMLGTDLAGKLLPGALPEAPPVLKPTTTTTVAPS